MIVIGYIIIFAFLLFLALIFGHGFREWNEGKEYTKKDNSPNSGIKTIVIGLIILFFIGILVVKCSGNYGY